jgi:radical SAM superfamily enzyme YgiQ (UPF0313 family)
MQVMRTTDQSSTAVDSFRVALVCMPFAIALAPSIQVGLLTAIAEQEGFPTDAYHLNLNLAASLTADVYEPLCFHRGHMTGEWLFSVAAFGEEAQEDDELYFKAFPKEIDWIKKQGKDAAFLSSMRHEILPRYIDDCLEMVDRGHYSVIGFSSTFQQNVASLALARCIKKRHPLAKIVFGGANFEGEMGPEYARAFPFIDYAVVGEGDIAFPALLRYLANCKGESVVEADSAPVLYRPEVAEQGAQRRVVYMPGRSTSYRDGTIQSVLMEAHQTSFPTTGITEDVPFGVVMRTANGIAFSDQAQPDRDTDALPTPNYTEYFERARSLGLTARRIIPFESSRGCWWGQKHHCTFCGLNGYGLAFRAKTPKRVFDELTELAHKHRISYFEAVDNMLDRHYLKDFFTTIEQTRTDYQFFYEVKANLTHEQIRTLYRGGVRSIQPGIESLSSHVLQLMRKGCTMLQNVRLLKWCRYYNMSVGWNLIWGFPGETMEDYLQGREVLKLISHLQPPRGYSRIWPERFAPYFTDRDLFPIHDIRPEASYRYVYPTQVALDRMAYFFDYRMEQTVSDDMHEETRELVEEWQRRWNARSPDTLVYRRTNDALFIDENRGSGRRLSYAFDGPSALMYEYCSETMQTSTTVVEFLETALGWPRFTRDDVQRALEEFCRLGLMLTEDGKYLSLALPVNPNW